MPEGAGEQAHWRASGVGTGIWSARLGAVARVRRSPPGQPRWARPALLAIAALAGVAYGWGMGGAVLEAFYGAAARSMSTSWHNFLFGAFDPAGTVTIDKIPGAEWPQALALRVFGFHIWAIVLPQVIEGVVTVLVLYRAVCRLAGPVAGIVAAAVVASSPVTVALNRGNVADSLLLMLLVLAADACSSALLSGRLRMLLLAGVWVGVAFQAKMGTAWLVLPALAGAYLLAAPAPARTRVGHVALAGAVALAVSLSWMSAVSLVPAHDRPFVDGTQNNSFFSQTFQYNGFSRLQRKQVFTGAGHPAAFLVAISEGNAAPSHRVKPGPSRLLHGLFGRDDGWLLPAALLGAIGVLLASGGRGRGDPRRTLVWLWGVWLLTFAVFFSAGGYLNSYYVAALTPATGALCGAGAELAWSRRGELRARVLAAVALVCCVAYGIYLLHGGARVPGWLAPLAVVAGVLGALALLVGTSAPPRMALARALVAGACILVLPGVASVLVVTRGLGPFAAPYEPASATISRASQASSLRTDARSVEEASSTYGTPIAFATDSSILAAPFILASGREVLPIGGYQGGIPSPTLARLRQLVSSGELRAFLVPVRSEDPRVQWIHAHCTGSTGASSHSATATALYECASG